MAEKVKVSQKVVAAYQELLDKHEGNSLAVVYEWSEQLLPHKTDSILKTIDWHTLLALITDNHEIKLTPEEQILEKFNQMKNVEWDMYTDGMMFVLDLLDIKIEGVNE
ncbi:hypothetical protein J1907_17930 [Lysinibacillus sphaericus]|uniref:hypothetical protein n=1 Tax=Lysinibacillus sphaericus TaxID=1421 RepID=UPI0005600FDF|nr:hypothetical protein [Lysinibacillus sphaericus]QTB21606.1 hypothetical protein J1907_17930 [Lysinibacillus sphaericus]